MRPNHYSNRFPSRRASGLHGFRCGRGIPDLTDLLDSMRSWSIGLVRPYHGIVIKTRDHETIFYKYHELYREVCKGSLARDHVSFIDQ